MTLFQTAVRSSISEAFLPFSGYFIKLNYNVTDLWATLLTPMSYLIDQTRLLFWQTHYSNIVVLRTLSALKNNTFVAIGSKYDAISYNVAVKPAVWSEFAMSLESVLMWHSFEYAFEHISLIGLVLVFMYFTVYFIVCCCLLS